MQARGTSGLRIGAWSTPFRRSFVASPARDAAGWRFAVGLRLAVRRADDEPHLLGEIARELRRVARVLEKYLHFAVGADAHASAERPVWRHDGAFVAPRR